MLISPQGKKYEFSLPIIAMLTNNQTEYQAFDQRIGIVKGSSC